MKYSGVLVVDCSWRGMGCVAYTQKKTTWAKCYDVRGKQKHYDRPIYTIPQISLWVQNELSRDVPMWDLIDRVIIENQFHTKMKYLQYSVASAIMTHLGDAKLYFISALEAKRAVGVPLARTHHENKQNMLKYVQENQNHLVCGSLHQDNDNLADAIALLHTFLHKYKLQLDMSLNPNGPGLCPECEQETLWKNVVKKESKNKGRYFFSCGSDDCEHFSWADKKPAMKKRKFVPQTPKPPLKKQANGSVLQLEALASLDASIQMLASKIQFICDQMAQDNNESSQEEEMESEAGP